MAGAASDSTHLQERIEALEGALARRERRRRLRTVLVGAAVFGLLLSPVAVSRTGDALREGVRNGTASRETKIIARHSQAATRQSNVGSGPAAVYGCRRADAECTRHVNLRNGPAAHFATKGKVPFSIDPDAGGVVRGLNADKLDGLDASQIRAQLARAASSSPGAPGPKGDKGDTGDTGPAGPSLGALNGAFVYDDGLIKESFNRIDADAYVSVSDGDGVDTVDLPFPVTGRVMVVSGGTATSTGGQNSVCFHQLRHVNATRIAVHAETGAGTTCNEEWSILIF